MLNGIVIDEFGNKHWYKDNLYHREDGPAVEDADGTKEWFKDGRCHREDGPAAEGTEGVKVWWYKDIFVGKGDHPDPALWARLTSVEANGGPLLNGCIVDLFRVKFWYRDDVLHREDGPAVEYEGGAKKWCLYGKSFGFNKEGFWKLWDRLTSAQRANPNLLKHLPR